MQLRIFVLRHPILSRAFFDERAATRSTLLLKKVLHRGRVPISPHSPEASHQHDNSHVMLHVRGSDGSRRAVLARCVAFISWPLDEVPEAGMPFSGRHFRQDVPGYQEGVDCATLCLMENLRKEPVPEGVDLCRISPNWYGSGLVLEHTINHVCFPSDFLEIVGAVPAWELLDRGFAQDKFVALRGLSSLPLNLRSPPPCSTLTRR